MTPARAACPECQHINRISGDVGEAKQVKCSGCGARFRVSGARARPAGNESTAITKQPRDRPIATGSGPRARSGKEGQRQTKSPPSIRRDAGSGRSGGGVLLAAAIMLQGLLLLGAGGVAVGLVWYGAAHRLGVHAARSEDSRPALPAADGQTPTAPAPDPRPARPSPQTRPSTRPSPEPAPQPAPRKPDPPAERTPLGADVTPVTSTVRLFVPRDPARTPAARPVVVLDRITQPALGPATYKGVLTRELIRQALLIAAREELGLPTRDLTLRETVTEMPAHETKVELQLVVILRAAKAGWIRLEKRKGDERETLWTRTFPLDPEGPNYGMLAEVLERCSRTELPKALRKAGFEGEPVAVGMEAPTPEPLAERLNTMNCLTQFGVIRELHEMARARGTTRQITADLVRAYAHMGTLIEFHLNTAHKVCKARALLYAQRLVAQDARSPWPLWHRAYAHALVGLHAAALADLEEASKRENELKAAGSPVPPRPAWVELLDASCRFDIARLEALAPRHGQLGDLLHYLAVEDLQTPVLSLNRAWALIKDNPECYRVNYAVCCLGALGDLHRATVLGPTTLSRTLPDRLTEMPRLPAEVAALVKAADPVVDEVRLLRMLQEVGQPQRDPAEASWSWLASLIRETRFLQVYRRLDFMRHRWSVPTDEFLEAALPWVADHPFRASIEAYGMRGPALEATAVAVRRQVDPAELEPHWGLWISALARLAPANPAVRETRPIVDQTYGDLAMTIEVASVAPMKTALARFLGRVSPHAPKARAILIEHAWDSVSKDAAEWEKSAARQGAVLRALGIQYSRQKQFDAAERCLRAYLRLSPDYAMYNLLASNYLAQGQPDRWQATLEEVLQHEDHGLFHAQVRVKLARYFMDRKEYGKALPHAEAAAETWASWALQCAMQCNELLGNWERSELWAKRNAERYPDACTEWYSWCQRTGRGDVSEAARVAMRGLQVQGLQDREEYFMVAANHAILSGQPRQALAMTRKFYEATDKNVLLLPLIAVLADELELKTVRDDALKEVPADHPMSKLTRQFQSVLAVPGTALNLQAADAVIAEGNPKAQALLCYCVGRFLELHGRLPDALRYYDRAARDRRGHIIGRTAAASLLQKHGKEPSTPPPKPAPPGNG